MRMKQSWLVTVCVGVPLHGAPAGSSMNAFWRRPDRVWQNPCDRDRDRDRRAGPVGEKGAVRRRRTRRKTWKRKKRKRRRSEKREVGMMMPRVLTPTPPRLVLTVEEGRTRDKATLTVSSGRWRRSRASRASATTQRDRKYTGARVRLTSLGLQLKGRQLKR